jgi:hypothetical protein
VGFCFSLVSARPAFRGFSLAVAQGRKASTDLQSSPPVPQPVVAGTARHKLYDTLLSRCIIVPQWLTAATPLLSLPLAFGCFCCFGLFAWFLGFCCLFASAGLPSRLPFALSSRSFLGQWPLEANAQFFFGHLTLGCARVTCSFKSAAILVPLIVDS